MHDNNGFAPDEQPATREEIVAAHVARSGRKNGVPIRKAFLQQGGRGRLARPGPLATLVRNGDLVALNAYLFARLMGTADPWDVQLESKIWALMLNLDGRNKNASSGLVSKALRRLEDAKLITRSRAGRRSVVYPLHEAGNGEPYTELTGGSDDPYIQVPLAYWMKDWHRELQLPGVTMMLIALDQPRQFWLTADKVKAWYFVSDTTANRGYAELERHGLIVSKYQRVKDSMSTDGLQRRLMRRLAGDFARPKRKPALQTFFNSTKDEQGVPHLRVV